MKKSLTLLVLFITVSLSAQNFNSALEYLEFIGKKQETISKNSWKYTKAVAHSKSTAKIRQRRKVLIRSVDKAIKNITHANGFQGDDFKNKVLENLKLQKQVLLNDYSKIIDMKEVAEKSYDLMEAFFMAKEMADKKLEKAQGQYESDYYAFALKNRINIVEDESDLGKKMKISSEVFKYYNKMYLIFFRVSVNEVLLMDALNQNDVSGIQQYANSLAQEAKDGTEKLKTIDLYKKDESIVKVTQKAFDFYLDEADNKVPQLLDFLMLKEDFEHLKKVIDKTPQRKRTKEQIDAFNKKVKEFNKGVKTFNKVNNELNINRSKMINKYNNVNQQFLSKHIPND